MDIMIDIETLGVARTSRILSIGTVDFDPHRCNVFPALLGHANVAVIDEASYVNERVVFTVDPDTVKFWEARPAELERLRNHPRKVPLDVALRELITYLSDVRPERVWANSPQFDLEILRHAFAQYGFPVPWMFWQERDVRTLLDAARVDKRLGQFQPRELLQHRAEHDAAWQAWLVQLAHDKIAARVDV